VTLPFVLLLLDVWPLRRLPLAPRPWRDWAADLRRLVVEKAPLFALAAAASAVTVWAQRGSIGSLAAMPLERRIANALVSYVVYLGKTFWPRDLAVFYPLPPAAAFWKAALAAGLLVGLTALALARLRRAPWLATGWLWFLGMLVPVIGLVQVGSQAMADRYTYLPSIGLFLALAWEVPERLGWDRRARRFRVAATAVGLLALLGLAAVARAQVRKWQDTLTLFRHAAAVTEDNYLAMLAAGNQLAYFERREEAERYFRGALRVRPNLHPALRAYALSLHRWGRPAEALPLFHRAVRLRRRDPLLRVELAAVLADLGRRDEAIAELRRALALAPGLARARARLRALERAPPAAAAAPR
jgi:protein O-mannosyl-transferase